MLEVLLVHNPDNSMQVTHIRRQLLLTEQEPQHLGIPERIGE